VCFTWPLPAIRSAGRGVAIAVESEHLSTLWSRGLCSTYEDARSTWRPLAPTVCCWCLAHSVSALHNTYLLAYLRVQRWAAISLQAFHFSGILQTAKKAQMLSSSLQHVAAPSRRSPMPILELRTVRSVTCHMYRTLWWAWPVCCAGMERCASLRWLPDTVSMEASAGRPIVIAFEPVMQELSQGMLWIHVNGKCAAFTSRSFLVVTVASFQ